VLQLVHERELMVHAQTIPGGLSRRVIVYSVSPELTEAFRREHPPKPEGAFYGSSSEDDECKYPNPMGERAPDDGDDEEAWLQRQEARRELLANEAVRPRYVGEHIPFYQRLAEIENTVEKRLRTTVEVSPWFVSGVHWLCKLCGQFDPAMRGKNWVDEDDPGDERYTDSAMDGAKMRRDTLLRSESWLRISRKVGASLRLARRSSRSTYASVRARREFRAAYPRYRGPWPMRLPPVGDIYDVRDAYFNMELKQPYVDEPPRARVPAVKLEPEPGPDPRRYRPTAFRASDGTVHLLLGHAACE
jgi:hypothetical protein